jgi:uncharacterized membrane protein YfcA
MLDSLTLYAMVVIFLATLIRSVFGFGEALFAVPLLALRMPIAVAAPLAVLVSVLVAGAVVIQDWRSVEWRSAAGLILSALFGIPLGLWLLAKGDDRLVRSLLGVILVAFSAYSLAGRTKLRLHQNQWGWLIGCGFLSGVLGGAYGMNGPPLAFYGALRRWSPQHFRATLQGYFLPASVVGLVGYLALGLWGAAVTRYFLWSLPGVVVAVSLGRAINQRMKGREFFRFVYVGLVIIGITLVVQGI